jgi:hypothetical protein
LMSCTMPSCLRRSQAERAPEIYVRFGPQVKERELCLITTPPLQVRG